jgi:hypothetical protein
LTSEVLNIENEDIEMKYFYNIIFSLVIITFTGLFSEQSASGQAGTTESQEKKTEAASIPKDISLSIEENKNQAQQNNPDQDNNKDKKKDKDNKQGSVKQVKSDHPDMSRSRGARPPDIVRPSGSRIPKGVGRPAGAGRRGRG